MANFTSVSTSDNLFPFVSSVIDLLNFFTNASGAPFLCWPPRGAKNQLVFPSMDLAMDSQSYSPSSASAIFLAADFN